MAVYCILNLTWFKLKTRKLKSHGHSVGAFTTVAYPLKRVKKRALGSSAQDSVDHGSRE